MGSSSRAAGGHTLGCLVVSNYGATRDLHLLIGHEVDLPDAGPESQGGSIMIVLGTDAPLSERQLRRLALRGTFGLGRAGSFGANASGEYVIAFSTAHRVAHRVERDTDDFTFLRDDSAAMRDLFEAAGEVVLESVLNSLCAADADGGPRRQPRRGLSPRAPRRGAVPSAGLTKTRAASPRREPSARRTCRTRSSCSRSCRTSR